MCCGELMEVFGEWVGRGWYFEVDIREEEGNWWRGIEEEGMKVGKLAVGKD